MYGIILQGTPNPGSQYLLYFIAGLVGLATIIVIWRLHNRHYTEEELEHIKAMDISWRKIPVRSYYDEPPECVQFVDEEMYRWPFLRWITRIRGLLSDKSVHIQTQKVTDGDGEPVYLARINQKYTLAFRDKLELLEVVDNQYIEDAFEHLPPYPHESERHYEYVKRGIMDFGETLNTIRGKKITRLDGDTLTRIHSNLNDTPPSSTWRRIKEIAIAYTSSKDLTIYELRKRMIMDFRYPKDRVDHWIMYLIRRGQISVIDEDGNLASYMT